MPADVIPASLQAPRPLRDWPVPELQRQQGVQHSAYTRVATTAEVLDYSRPIATSAALAAPKSPPVVLKRSSKTPAGGRPRQREAAFYDQHYLETEADETVAVLKEYHLPRQLDIRSNFTYIDNASSSMVPRTW
jgi:hypothetical protein